MQSDKLLQKQIWRFVSNPGVILYRGEVIGIWRSKKKKKGIEIKMTLWDKFHVKQKLFDLAEEYANFRQQKLVSVEI